MTTLTTTFAVSVVVATTVSLLGTWLYLDHLRPWLVEKGVVVDVR